MYIGYSHNVTCKTDEIVYLISSNLEGKKWSVSGITRSALGNTGQRWRQLRTLISPTDFVVDDDLIFFLIFELIQNSYGEH